jgi:hypothetical protein
MEKEQDNYIKEENKKENLCENCVYWPCYATPPDCFRYETEV